MLSFFFSFSAVIFATSLFLLLCFFASEFLSHFCAALPSVLCLAQLYPLQSACCSRVDCIVGLLVLGVSGMKPGESLHYLPSRRVSASISACCKGALQIYTPRLPKKETLLCACMSVEHFLMKRPRICFNSFVGIKAVVRSL